MTSEKELKELAETVGALQDTLRVHANGLDRIMQHQYGVIVSLDLVYMEIVSMLPEKIRKGTLQNSFDESLSGAENDLVALKKLRRYINRRIRDCRKFIKSHGGSTPTPTEEDSLHE